MKSNISQRDSDGSPPPSLYPSLKPNRTVLFHGDSITDGGWLRNSTDLNHTMGQSYAYLIAAKLGLELAGRNLTFVNRGVGSTGIAAIGTGDALQFIPCLISIATGINDCMGYLGNPATGGLSGDRYEAVYDKLINEFRTVLPTTQLVLVAPFFLDQAGSERDVTCRAALQPYQNVVDRLGQKYKWPVVRLQTAFDAALKIAPAHYWCWDGVHPTYAGHAIIAREWLKVVAALAAC